MTNPLWAVAMALPLVLAGCGAKEEAKTVAAAPAAVEPAKEDVVSTNPTPKPNFSAEQKEKLRAPLLALAKAESKGEAMFGAVAGSSGWQDVIGVDQPIHYARCVVASGPSIPATDCHLYVNPTGPDKPGTPPRWLRFEKNSNGTIWASIRSGVDARERMECDSLDVDGSFLSGWCDVKPHDGSGSHWLEFAVLMSSTKKRESVSFVYYDKEPTGLGSDVHNGEGHGGTN